MLDEAAVPYQLVLTKVDKINPHELAEVEAETLQRIKKRAAAIQTIHLTSAEKLLGIDGLKADIAGLVRT
jgi:GTP-binding protein